MSFIRRLKKKPSNTSALHQYNSSIEQHIQILRYAFCPNASIGLVQTLKTILCLSDYHKAHLDNHTSTLIQLYARTLFVHSFSTSGAYVSSSVMIYIPNLKTHGFNIKTSPPSELTTAAPHRVVLVTFRSVALGQY